MDKAVLNSMTTAEQRLVAETAKAALADLDEEELLALHSRIRRARSKYVTSYRRSAAGAVVKRGGRGFAYPKNKRDRDKAEVFETALAQVSREVAAHASRAAAELKEERLAAARPTKAPAKKAPKKAPAKAAPKAGPATARTKRPTTKTSGGTKQVAGRSATGARRQAKRDA
ncbi:hypothetical protein [Marmoricola sp. RAF53]|uniref:hypothetical protein n=1 Tax=Marmoricola sp. RAF53 TaxID=3233059 RepID=UPI003F9C5935